MKRYRVSLLLFPLLFLSCKNQDLTVAKIQGEQIQVSDSIQENQEIEAYIAPFRERIAEEMDAVLSFTPYSLDKKEGNLNTAIGNMMADAVMEMAGPVFKQRTGQEIDLVLLNHGGIRSTISKGDITTSTAYEIMPFENEVVVAALKGAQLQEMISYLIQSKTAHPIAGMQLWINQSDEVLEALVQGEPIEEEKIYFVATNDYLMQGGDNMNFFQKAEEEYVLDYKIRNLLIDYFKKIDTIAPVIDQRFIRK